MPQDRAPTVYCVARMAVCGGLVLLICLPEALVSLAMGW
jgi:hypothetical protein